jgi:hypothetical protein
MMQFCVTWLLAVTMMLVPAGEPEVKPVKMQGAQWCRLPDGRAALLVNFTVQPGWHMYWTNPGDSGGPPVAKATLPDGWKLGTPIWPRPTVLKHDDEVLFVHEGAWSWLVPVEGPAPDALPTFGFELRVSWMVCKEACEIGKASLQVVPPSVPPQAAPAKGGAGSFPIKPGSGDSAICADGGLHLRFDARGQSSARFLQATNPGVQVNGSNPVPARISEGKALLDAPLQIRPEDSLGQELAISGLLLLGDSIGDPCVWIRQSVSTPARSAP